MTVPVELLTAARAEALFASDLPSRSHPTRAEVAAAIRRAVRTHGGTRGCATVLAGAYGECPETAVPRMRWALSVVHAMYAGHVEVAPAATPGQTMDVPLPLVTEGRAS